MFMHWYNLCIHVMLLYVYVCNNVIDKLFNGMFVKMVLNKLTCACMLCLCLWKDVLDTMLKLCYKFYVWVVIRCKLLSCYSL
jgi:hypothetical protein